MRILAISTHPDDETLGCGGTLLKHRDRGDELFWLIATQAHTPQWPAEIVDRKSAEIEAVAKAYGMKRVFRLGCPATRLDTVLEGDLIGKLREGIREVRPDIVYLMHGGDVHSDHRAVFDGALAVIKPFYMKELGIRKVMSYETLSSTEAAPPLSRQPFIPNTFSDITGYLARKIEIMQLFASEMQDELSPRGASAITALARYRGATIGVEHAEAFMLVREIC